MAALKLRREQQEAARRAHEDRRARQRAAGKRVDGPWPASDLVFTTGVGTSYEPGNLTKMFPARSRKAGVGVIRLHDTRHTCGSLLVALGVHPRVVMEIMRHTQIAITMEIHSHVPSADTRAALEQLGDSLGQNPATAVLRCLQAPENESGPLSGSSGKGP
ncbi:tyrosine-type recombinase/integrase [Embleya sp. NPDC050493]|uniref:tyrosine-type recombinase/integrase n=1 Tax=Embleya sp. NPDC050493 TaxID=3363989 RepID=UPI003787D9B4